MWGTLKNYVVTENADFKVETAEQLFRDKRDQLPKEFQNSFVKHVMKIEDDYLMSDPIADVQVDEMIFEVDPDDTSGSDASDIESEMCFCGSSIAVSSDEESDPLDL